MVEEKNQVVIGGGKMNHEKICWEWEKQWPQVCDWRGEIESGRKLKEE